MVSPSTLPPSAHSLLTIQAVISLTSKPMGIMLMKRDHVLKIAPLVTHPGLPSHGSDTHFASSNTFMIVLPRGASPNSSSLTFTRMVSRSSRCMIVCRHSSNLQPIAAHSLRPNWSPTSAAIDTNMNTSFPLSNLFLPPHSSLTFSNLYLGMNSRLAKAP